MLELLASHALPPPHPMGAFTRQQTCALQALANGLTPSAAAKQAATHRSQIYRWIDQSHFRVALENAQREHYAAVAVRFHTLAVDALDALEQILDDPKSSPHARIKAANLIFARMERSQTALPQSVAEAAAIDLQCNDQYAPHLVIGGTGPSVTDPDALLDFPHASARQILTPIEETPAESASATDPDSPLDAAVRQIQTPSEEPADESQGVTDPDTVLGPPPVRQILTELRPAGAIHRDTDRSEKQYWLRWKSPQRATRSGIRQLPNFGAVQALHGCKERAERRVSAPYSMLVFWGPVTVIADDRSRNGLKTGGELPSLQPSESLPLGSPPISTLARYLDSVERPYSPASAAPECAMTGRRRSRS